MAADNEAVIVAISNLSDAVKEQNGRHNSFVLKTDTKLDKIQDKVSQSIVLFEKLANIEKNQFDSTKRMYLAIDTEIAKRQELSVRVKLLEDKPRVLFWIVSKGFLIASGAGLFAYIVTKLKGQL